MEQSEGRKIQERKILKGVYLLDAEGYVVRIIERFLRGVVKVDFVRTR